MFHGVAPIMSTWSEAKKNETEKQPFQQDVSRQLKPT